MRLRFGRNARGDSSRKQRSPMRMAPASGSISLRQQRATVDLPETRLTHDAQRLAGIDAQAQALHLE
jgi:hypothetical protein